MNLENASRIRAKLLIYGLFQKGRVLAQDVTRNAPLILPVARPGSPHETSSGLVPRSPIRWEPRPALYPQGQ